MSEIHESVIILKEDFQLLSQLIKGSKPAGIKESHKSRSLSEELENATVLDKDEFPEDVIRLNSTVTIQDLSTKKEMKIIIVMPEHADIKQQKVSVLAPLGTALIGFRKGSTVKWHVPAGEKEFLIKEVA